MEAREIIEFIGNAEKKTPVKVYVKEKEPVDFAGCQVFGNGDKIVFGDWAVVQPILAENADKIEDFVVENDCRNSAIPLLDMKNIKARIEPGAFIRDKVEIGDNAVIMMGAIINIGAVFGEGSLMAAEQPSARTVTSVQVQSWQGLSNRRARSLLSWKMTLSSVLMLSCWKAAASARVQS